MQTRGPELTPRKNIIYSKLKPVRGEKKKSRSLDWFPAERCLQGAVRGVHHEGICRAFGNLVDE